MNKIKMVYIGADTISPEGLKIKTFDIFLFEGKDVYFEDNVYYGITIDNNDRFIPLAEYREQQINIILNE